MRILIATPEAVPYAKTGGLADISGSLLKAFRRRSMKVSLILPLYRSIGEGFSLHDTGHTISVMMGDVRVKAGIWASDASAIPEAYFIKCDELFGRSELYGGSSGDYEDNALRFAFFSRAVLDACIALDIRPDIIHCHDWQTGLVPLYLKSVYRGHPFFAKTTVLFTIHNLGYQGRFDASEMRYTGLDARYFSPEGIEFYGLLNFLKSGLVYSDILNTVSRTYTHEIRGPELGYGLDGVLRSRQDDLFGVINGIDWDEWDPASDTFIPAGYDADAPGGKRLCRRELLRKTGLAEDESPVFSLVGRLSGQKGIDILAGAIDGLMALGVRLLILGRGEDRFHGLMEDYAGRYRSRMFVHIGFEDALAHLMYAGSDFFLMPSLYEPCGLGQIIALRYGTVPVARRTGGLVDTIRDYDHLISTGTGFHFSDYTSSALLDGVKRALCVFSDSDRMSRLISAAMKVDFSWDRSAEEYLKLYKKAAGKLR